ncbi:MAG TPA: thiamine-phosphate kinase [Chthoniobacteraceae bacterium]|nr:thiamine-phosphate kinase [Chthoniobacteraceae bacterium]
MKLAGYGEDRLVRELTRALPARRADVRVGIGDDCAVIGAKSAARWTLLKTDCIIEGVHFLKTAPARKVGWKALARALSDIAAMGGEPSHALVTIAAPATMRVAWLKGFYAGLREAAGKFGVVIVGGETARSPGAFFCSVALTGVVERKRCVTRSGARGGDALYVTGRLGGSIRGRHLAFTPRIAEARWLTQHFQLHAMMDLSDGLGSDLPRLAEASRCGFLVHEEKIPVTPGCTTRHALADGEDYELLFAIHPRDTKRLESAWKKRFPKLPLTRIGALVSNLKSEIGNLKSTHGFDHYA